MSYVIERVRQYALKAVDPAYIHRGRTRDLAVNVLPALLDVLEGATEWNKQADEQRQCALCGKWNGEHNAVCHVGIALAALEKELPK